MIYLDHAATTPPDESVIEAMNACMRAAWANPGAAYAAAGAARRALRQARCEVAALLNAAPEELLFTSGGTEGNNHALTLAAGGHVVLSAIEHASVLNAARRQGCAVTLVAPDIDGVIQPEAVERALRPDTRLISVQFANNETGVLQPVREIGALARRRRVPFHCDAVQAFGHVPVDVRACSIDLLTVSAHKCYGPRGIGGLFVRTGTPLLPMLAGGGQEFGLRAGTEDVAAAAGFGAAAMLARAELADHVRRERALMDGFIRRLCAVIPDCVILGGCAPRLPGIAAVLLPGLSSEQAIAELDQMGIQVSGGAACAAQSREVSHVYRAMGLDGADARCVLRVSIGRSTTAEDLCRAAEAIKQVYARRTGRIDVQD